MSNNTNLEFLIIDDDLLNLHVTKKQIVRAFPDSEVKTFIDAIDGLNYMQSDTMEASAAIVLLDIRMPLLNGWEFVEAFATLPEAVQQRFKICMFSSSMSNLDRQKAHDSPYVRQFIEKPLGLRELGLIREEVKNLKTNS